jgi:hypothetical protein
MCDGQQVGCKVCMCVCGSQSLEEWLTRCSAFGRSSFSFIHSGSVPTRIVFMFGRQWLTILESQYHLPSSHVSANQIIR